MLLLLCQAIQNALHTEKHMVSMWSVGLRIRLLVRFHPFVSDNIFRIDMKREYKYLLYNVFYQLHTIFFYIFENN